MKFQVTARKWRPQKFSELIGQEHIVRTLRNAIELDRIAHAYLFSGTRGVGKTTTARLLAKALNCEQGPTPEPCDVCTHCQEIREGTSIDVLEIDGASNTGVNEVRELIENIQYSASACRFKVYIIDEVHMLSKSAFNALLKTLEEPPPQVVFIFATTELIKIPETILSRCQCFEFKPLSHKQIVAQLALISQHDGIEIDPQSLDEIAKNGAGSMRDSQSLLDQVIAFSGREVPPDAVEAVLGVVGQNTLESFIDRVIDRDASGLLELVQEVLSRGKDLGFFCRDLIEYVRNLMLVQVAKNPESLLDARSCNLESLKRQAQKLHGDELHQMFDVLNKADIDMKRASLPQMIFEMAILRLIDVRPYQEIDVLIDKINQMEGPAVTPTVSPAATAQTEAGGTSQSKETPVQTQGNGSAPPPAAAPGNAGDTWGRIRSAAKDKKRLFDHILTDDAFVSLTDKGIHLSFPDPYTLEMVQKEENLGLLKLAIEETCGIPDISVKLDLRSGSVAESMPAPAAAPEKKKPKNYGKKGNPSEEEILKDALDIFGGMVIR